MGRARQNMNRIDMSGFDSAFGGRRGALYVDTGIFAIKPERGAWARPEETEEGSELDFVSKALDNLNVDRALVALLREPSKIMHRQEAKGVFNRVVQITVDKVLEDDQSSRTALDVFGIRSKTANTLAADNGGMLHIFKNDKPLCGSKEDMKFAPRGSWIGHKNPCRQCEAKAPDSNKEVSEWPNYDHFEDDKIQVRFVEALEQEVQDEILTKLTDPGNKSVSGDQLTALTKKHVTSALAIALVALIDDKGHTVVKKLMGDENFAAFMKHVNTIHPYRIGQLVEGAVQHDELKSLIKMATTLAALDDENASSGIKLKTRAGLQKGFLTFFKKKVAPQPGPVRRMPGIDMEYSTHIYNETSYDKHGIENIIESNQEMHNPLIQSKQNIPYLDNLIQRKEDTLYNNTISSLHNIEQKEIKDHSYPYITENIISDKNPDPYEYKR